MRTGPESEPRLTKSPPAQSRPPKASTGLIFSAKASTRSSSAVAQKLGSSIPMPQCHNFRPPKPATALMFSAKTSTSTCTAVARVLGSTMPRVDSSPLQACQSLSPLKTSTALMLSATRSAQTSSALPQELVSAMQNKNIVPKSPFHSFPSMPTGSQTSTEKETKLLNSCSAHIGLESTRPSRPTTLQEESGSSAPDVLTPGKEPQEEMMGLGQQPTETSKDELETDDQDFFLSLFQYSPEELDRLSPHSGDNCVSLSNSPPANPQVCVNFCDRGPQGVQAPGFESSLGDDFSQFFDVPSTSFASSQSLPTAESGQRSNLIMDMNQPVSPETTIGMSFDPGTLNLYLDQTGADARSIMLPSRCQETSQPRKRRSDCQQEQSDSSKRRKRVFERRLEPIKK